jgi:LacI family transcriptional regulator
MQQVADELGVSLATVSLAFRDSPVVARATREKVRTAASRLGYVYNRGAANLRRSRSNLIGLVVPAITNPFVAEMATGVQESISASGFVLLLTNTVDDIDRQREVIRALAEQRAAGAIIIPVLGTPPDDLRPSTAAAMPLVLVNRDVEGLNLPFVQPDEEYIVDLAMQHLVDVHHVMKVGYFGGVEEAAPRMARLARLRNLAAKSHLSFADEWAALPAPTPASAYAAAREMLANGSIPESLVCHSDELAWSLLRALQEARIPPDRCRVIGIDGIATSAMFTPSLTTVFVDASGEGSRAGTVLLNRIHGEAKLAALRPPSLIVRESCGC